MNILIVTATYPPSANGVANSVQRFARALSDLGHTVGVVGPSSGKEADVRIRYMDLPTLPRIAGIMKDYPLAIPVEFTIERALNTVHWDIVHVHHPSFFARMAVRIAKKRGIPVVFTYHTQYEAYINHFLTLAPLNQWIYKTQVTDSIKEMNAIIAPSRWMERYLSHVEDRRRLHVVSSAGLTENFFTQTKKQDLRQYERPIFLVVMRLSREKNIPLAIRAFGAWRSKAMKGTLLVVGTGEEERKLRILVGKLGLEKHVIFLGKKKNSDMPSWYQSVDVLLYPSLSEVAPLTILEAMASGLPIVAVNHQATREFLKEGEIGVITKPTVTDFTRGITRALNNKKNLSRAAKVHARTYHITQTTGALLSLYVKLINQKRDF